MASKLVLLSKLKDNPWRDKKRNPINPEQVERLAESIETTEEFWEGVYGREVAEGFVELAFGHHRVDAARLAGLKEIPITLRSLTDGEMLMRMARENMRGELPIVLEAVSAAVRALSEGKIVLPALDPSTRKDTIRYAPSFIPGKVPAPPGGVRPYTVSTIARFLGSIYYRKSSGFPQDSVVAALSILELEEMKIEGFKVESLRKEERIVPKTEGVNYDPKEQEEIRYKPNKEIIKILADVKHNYKTVQERRGKSQAEIASLRTQQLAAQVKAKADERAAEETHKALIKKLAEADRDKRNQEADRLKADLLAKDERAKEKAALNKIRMAELDQQIIDKKKWEAAQAIQDEYLPIRRDVEMMLGKMDTIVTESNPFREQVKALSANKKLSAVDRLRLRKAAVAVADWYGDWVAPQFAPEMKSAQMIEVIKRKKQENGA